MTRTGKEQFDILINLFFLRLINPNDIMSMRERGGTREGKNEIMLEWERKREK